MASSHDNKETPSQASPSLQQYREKASELEHQLKLGNLSRSEKLACELRLSVIRSELNTHEKETITQLESMFRKG
jgi:hypothetical protein